MTTLESIAVIVINVPFGCILQMVNKTRLYGEFFL